MKSIGTIRRELLHEASASDLVLRYGLHELTAAAILAVGHSRTLEEMAAESRWQGWVHPENESKANRAADEFDRLADMCIAHDYCTCMDNDQYSKMLNWVNETTFGANEIETLARWIANGSDFSDRETEDPVASVAYSIMNEAITWIPIMNVQE